jgi:hypothetical protein
MSLFLDLRKHGKLAEKRNPMYEKSKFGKFWMYFMFVFWAGYLIFFGTTFAFAFDGGATEAYHVMNSGLIFVLVLDFLIRLPFQKTPTQEVKPYLLLPIKQNRLIDFLLIRSGLDGFNLFWLFLFVPFSIITVTKFYGISGVLTYCIGIWLLMVFNNYWFLLCRTLMGERIWWLALPVVVIEYHQQPDANAIGQHTTDSIEFGDGDDGKRNKQKQPEQIEAIQSGTDQQEVYKTILFDGKQQVGLHFLGGCFLERQAYQEIQHKDKYQSGVHYVIGFCGTTVKGECKGRTEEYQVTGPEDEHEVHPEFSEFTFFVHRISFFCQFSVLAQI